MQSTRHDTTLAALHAGSGYSGPALDVVVLTADAGLLATLQEASGPEHAIWPAQAADAIVDLLVGGRCGVLIVDLGMLRADSAALLERLHAQFPELILLVTGRREEEGAVAPLVSNGCVYRFLHKPISPARANLFIAAATRRFHELRNLEPALPPTPARMRASRPMLRRIVAVGVAILAALIALFIWQSRNEPASASLRQARSELATEQQIATQLGRAQFAFAAGRVYEPKGDNALEYFLAVLALQPRNADARQGLDRIAVGLEARVREALQARDAPQGAIALTALQRAQPGNPRLEALRAELVTMSRSLGTRPAIPPAGSAPRTMQAQPAGAGTPATELLEHAVIAEASERGPASASFPPEELASIIRLREQGALIEPPANNAYDRFIALRERLADSDEMRTEQQRLALVLLDRTRTALAAGDVDAAAAFVTRADTLVPGMATAKELLEQVAADREEHRFVANVVQATTLERVRESPPVYPRQAERDGIEGWVDVEFTIAPDGTTRDFTVRGAEPKDVFEKPAIESLRRWRFKPVMSNGIAVRQRAKLRVVFVLR